MKKNKYLFIIPNNVPGGAERVMSILSNELSKREYDIVYVTFDSESNFYNLNNDVRQIRMNLGTEKYNKFEKILILPFLEIKRYKKLNSILKSERPKCVISFMFMTNIISYFSCKKNKIPLILSERNDPTKYGKIKRLIMKSVYSKVQGFVCQSNKMKKYAEKEYRLKNVVVIPNPLSKNQIDTITIKKENKIINVGRLIPQKNQKFLIETFSKLDSKFNDYKLYIYGEGPLRKELENYVKELDLESRVFLPGVKKDVLKLNRDSKLFILTSNWEGYPNVLVEAMANGICSISSKFPSGSVEDIIKNGVNGFCFEPNDINNLKKIIEDLLSSDEKINRISKEGKKIFDEINVDKITDKWLNYIDSVI